MYILLYNIIVYVKLCVPFYFLNTHAQMRRSVSCNCRNGHIKCDGFLARETFARCDWHAFDDFAMSKML